MSKRDNNTIVMADFKAKKQDEGALEIQLSDGTKIHLDPPELWPDETESYIQAKDNSGLSRFLLGDEDYDRFLADGGSAALLGAMIEERHGTDVGKSKGSEKS